MILIGADGVLLPLHRFICGKGVLFRFVSTFF